MHLQRALYSVVAIGIVAKMLSYSPSPSAEAGEKQDKVAPLPKQQDKGGLIVPIFGLKPRGSDFVVIADRSGSMAAGKKYWDYEKRKYGGGKSSIDYLCQELKQAIDKVAKGGRMRIFLYDSVIEEQPVPGYAATNADFKTLQSWVKGIKPRGKTLPYAAFQKTFQMKPLPDVIIFMSDGVIPDVKNFGRKVGALWLQVPKEKRPKIFTVQMNVPGRDTASLLMSRWFGKPRPPAINFKIRFSMDKRTRDLQNPKFVNEEAKKEQTQINVMKNMANVSGGKFREIKANPGSMKNRK